MRPISNQTHFSAFGSVYLGKHKASNTLVAIKRTDYYRRPRFRREILKEIEIMKECDSPYVVTYYGSHWKREEE